ncbi:hypothetical protein [Mesorhizobium sp. B4-1-4]|uniref:hypothetical protein n=1 Tax=Mesorhizobium sp. B4-1-4 TaxID=2589888 RepID=UPI001128C378|nr:hypothetical protein [Mesorhizobium sp. B4-1-4]UCI32547.1 hypothetical protein FJW03_03570 [Mesorhizobium sp. B4-1-4]
MPASAPIKGLDQIEHNPVPRGAPDLRLETVAGLPASMVEGVVLFGEPTAIKYAALADGQLFESIPVTDPRALKPIDEPAQ